MPSVFNRCDGRHRHGKESDKEREASERERELKEASDLAETSEWRERIKWVLSAEGRRDSQAFRDCFPKHHVLTCQLSQTARLLIHNVCLLMILNQLSLHKNMKSVVYRTRSALEGDPLPLGGPS